MQVNMSIVDRVIRALIAVVIAVLYFTGRISGTLAIVLGVIAVAFFLTSLAARCPAYSLFGFSTRGSGDGTPGV
jgi:hypothetical protein